MVQHRCTCIRSVTESASSFSAFLSCHPSSFPALPVHRSPWRNALLVVYTYNEILVRVALTAHIDEPLLAKVRSGVLAKSSDPRTGCFATATIEYLTESLMAKRTWILVANRIRTSSCCMPSHRRNPTTGYRYGPSYPRSPISPPRSNSLSFPS